LQHAYVRYRHYPSHFADFCAVLRAARLRAKAFWNLSWIGNVPQYPGYLFPDFLV
jgi:hypothetical protein